LVNGVNGARSRAFEEIAAERERQAILWNRNHGWGWGDCSSSGVDMPVKLAALVEEVGEVSRAMLDMDPEAIRTELVHVAAVAVAWLEGMDR